MTMQLRHTVRQAQRGSQEAAQELLTQFEPLIRKQIAKYRHRYQSEAEARSTAHSAAMECIYSFDLSRSASVPREMQACIHNTFAREAYHHDRYQTMVQKDFIEKEAGRICRLLMKTPISSTPIHPSFGRKPCTT